MEKIKEPDMTLVESVSVKITKWIGTPASIIVHTFLFAGAFSMLNFGYTLDQILLVLTTIVSLEAIYLGIFVQMTVNRQERRLAQTHEEIQEISEDIEEIQEDVGEIQKDVDEMQEDVQELGEDVDQIHEGVQELGEDVEEISEDIEEDDKEDAAHQNKVNQQLQGIENTLQMLINQIEEMKSKK